MAEVLALQIKVDDQGSPVITSYKKTAQQGFAAASDAADKSTKKINKSFSKLRKSFDQVAKKALLVGTALATISFGLAVKGAIEFESAFAGVIKTFRGSDEALARVREDIKGLAQEIPATTTEIAKVAEVAGQLGVGADDVMKFTRVMIDLGNTTNISAEQAALSLAQFAAAMQMPLSQVDQLGSAIVALGNNFETQEGMIVDYAQRMAGVGKMAKMSAADIAGLGTALASLGVQSEAGATAAQKVIVDMVAAVATGSEELETFGRAMGITGKQFAEAFKEDATKTLVDFVEGLGEKGDEAIQILKDLKLENVRVIRSFIGLGGAGHKLRDAIALSNEEWEKNEALAKEAAERYKTVASQLKVLKNQISDVFVTLGEAFLPAIRESVTEVAALIAEARESGAIDEMKESVKKLGDMFVAATGFVIDHRGELKLLVEVMVGLFVVSKITAWGAAFKSAISGGTLAITGPGGALAALALFAIALNEVDTAFDKWVNDLHTANLAAFIEDANEAGKAMKRQADEITGLAEQLGVDRKKLLESFGSLGAAQAAAANDTAMSRLQLQRLGVTAEELQVAIDGVKSATLEAAAADGAATVAGDKLVKKKEEQKKQQDKLTAAQQEYADAVETATRSVLDSIGLISSTDAAVQMDALAASFQQAIDVFKGTGAEAPMLAAAQQMVDFAREAMEAGRALEASFIPQLQKAYDLLAEMSDLELDSLIDQELGPIGDPGLVDEFDDAIQRVLASAGDLENEFIVQLPASTAKSATEMAKDAEGMSASLGSVGDASRNAALRLVDNFAAGLEQGASLFESFATLAQGLLSNIGQDMSEGMSLGDSLSGMFEGGTRGEKGESAFAGIQAGAGTLMEGLSDPYVSSGEAIGGAVGEGIGTGVGGYFGGPIGAKIGGMLGKAFGGWLGGWIGGPAPWEEAQQDIEDRLGVTISDALAQTIQDTSEELGVDLDVAQLINLPGIIDEAEIGADNIGLFAEEVTGLFDVIEEGGAGSEEAMAALNESYASLIDTAVESDLTWTEGFANLIQNAKDSGIEIAAVSEFIAEKMAQATDGMIRMLDNVVNWSVERFQDLGEITAGIFEGLAFGEGGFLGAVEALGPAIDRLAQAQRDLGTESTEAMGKMLRIRAVVREHKALFESIAGLTDVTQGLGETGFITATAFEAIQRETGRLFTGLEGTALTQEERLESIAPLLQEIINEHTRTGKAIDENTMSLIRQAEELGLVDAHGTGLENTFREVGQAIVDVLGEAFGIEVPNLMYELGETAGDVGDRMADDWSNTADSIMDDFDYATDRIKGFSDDVMDAAADAAKAAADATGGVFEDATEQAKRYADEVARMMDRVGGISIPGREELGETMQSGGLAYGPEVVGAGEYVMPADVTAQPGVLRLLETLRGHGPRPHQGGQGSGPRHGKPGDGGAGEALVASATPNITLNATLVLDDGTRLKARVVSLVQEALDDREIDVPETALVGG